MENNQNNQNKQFSREISKDDSNLIFYKKQLSDTPKNENEAYIIKKNKKIINRNFVLDKIREKAPINISDLKRELGIGYSTLWDIVKSFEFVGLIYTTIQTDENNQEFKIIHLPENKIESKEND